MLRSKVESIVTKLYFVSDDNYLFIFKDLQDFSFSSLDRDYQQCSESDNGQNIIIEICLNYSLTHYKLQLINKLRTLEYAVKSEMLGNLMSILVCDHTHLMAILSFKW